MCILPHSQSLVLFQHLSPHIFRLYYHLSVIYIWLSTFLNFLGAITLPFICCFYVDHDTAVKVKPVCGVCTRRYLCVYIFARSTSQKKLSSVFGRGLKYFFTHEHTDSTDVAIRKCLSTRLFKRNLNYACNIKLRNC